jgi:hypothetical protein
LELNGTSARKQGKKILAEEELTEAAHLIIKRHHVAGLVRIETQTQF